MANTAIRVDRTVPFGTLIVPLMITRPSLDNVFGLVKLPVGGASLSLGFVFNIVIVLAAAMLAGHALLVNRKQQRALLAVAGIWGPFVFASLIASSYSPVPIEAIQLTFNFVTISAVAFIGMTYGATLSRSKLTVIVAASGFVPVFFGLFQVVLGLSGQRLSSTFGHPNIFAFFCLLYICFLFHAQLSGYIRRRAGIAVIWILIGATAIALLFTGTRSAYLSTLLFLLFYAALRKPWLVIPLSLVPLLAMMVPAVADRITDAISGSTPVSYDYFVSAMRGDILDAGDLALDSGTWRRYLWQAAWPWIEQRPALGYGMGSFAFYSGNFFPLSSDHGSGAHNVFVQLMFEGGLFLLGTYLVIYLGTASIFVRNFNKDKYAAVFVFLIILAFSLASLSDNMLNYLSVNISMWFIVSVFVGSVLKPLYGGYVGPALLTYRLSPRMKKAGEVDRP